MPTYKQVSEAHAYRVALLSERIQGLQRQVFASIEEQQRILASYGLADRDDIKLQTEPGHRWPVGYVLDAKTMQPIPEEPPPEEPPTE